MAASASEELEGFYLKYELANQRKNRKITVIL